MITERMQRNLLYRSLVEEEMPTSQIDLAGWTWPWRELILSSERESWMPLGISKLQYAIQMVAGDDMDARREWMAAIEDAAAPLHFPTLAELAATLEPVTWLWENWIPRGMLSLLGAFQGSGKSFFVMELARIALHGDAWPDGTPLTHEPATAKVVYVDAEGIPQVNAERAAELGIDAQRVYLMMADTGEMMDFNAQPWRDRLIDLLCLAQPDLVLIDSLSAITGAKGTNSAEEVSSLLTWLNGLAREFNTGLVLLHHLRKPGGGQLSLPGVSIHDFRGSTHIVAMARSVIGLSVVQKPGKQFSLNGPRTVEVVKTNLAPQYPPRLEVRMERGDAGVRFTYGPASPEADPEPSAEEWLIDYLETNGATKFMEIVADGERDGFSKATIYRARKRLGSQISDSTGKQGKGNLWVLSCEADDSAEDSAAEAE
jgi:hypothetical protein